MMTSLDDLPRIPARSPDSHKGDFGRALLIGGSRGMTGAITLAGMATLRGGAGLVKLAVPAGSQAIVAVYEPSYMTVGLPEDAGGRISGSARETIVQWAKGATVVAIGPGLGRSDELNELVQWLYGNLTQPMVIDADALNALSAKPQVLTQPAGARILTPHPGEFARLVETTGLDLAQRHQKALDLAATSSAVVVLKGHRTFITDGRHSAINTTGNPGMATGGTGDVLTGLTTALVCQQLSPFDAARTAVYLHGLAGDMAATELGEISLIARDLINYLPQAFKFYQDR